MIKRILFILHFTPPVHGSSVVGEQIRDSRLINNTIDGHYINLNTSRSLNEIGRMSTKKVLRYSNILRDVFVELLLNRPAISYIAITATGVAFYKDAIIVLLTKIFGVKTILHLHNKGVSTRQNKVLDNILYKLVFSNSEVIILSKYLYIDIKKYVNENRLHICFNGIPEVCGKVHKAENPIVTILFLSNLIESKGVFILLEACKLLEQNGINFQCVFVGGEGDISDFEFKAYTKKLHLHNHVVFVGKKYGIEKEELFLGADIFAFPTYYPYECLPLVLLEAMQFSLPVISTYEGGIPDVVIDKKTGFLIRQENVLELAEKLEELIYNKELRAKMGNAGRKLYEEKFTNDHFESRMHEILTSITK